MMREIQSTHPEPTQSIQWVPFSEGIISEASEFTRLVRRPPLFNHLKIRNEYLSGSGPFVPHHTRLKFPTRN
jgi:hypothetical protein